MQHWHKSLSSSCRLSFICWSLLVTEEDAAQLNEHSFLWLFKPCATHCIYSFMAQPEGKFFSPAHYPAVACCLIAVLRWSPCGVNPTTWRRPLCRVKQSDISQIVLRLLVSAAGRFGTRNHKQCLRLLKSVLRSYEQACLGRNTGAWQVKPQRNSLFLRLLFRGIVQKCTLRASGVS